MKSYPNNWARNLTENWAERQYSGMKYLNILLGVLLLVFVLDGCGRPLYQPNKEARRITAQLVDMAQSQGSILEDSKVKGYDLEIFPVIYRNAIEQYVHPLDGQALLAAAFEGVRAEAANNGALSLTEFDEQAAQSMLHSLDDYSSYMNAKAFRSFQEQTNGAYAGLGIQVSKHEKGILVISPFEGSPADKVGVKPGDVITHADGVALEGLTMDQSINRLRGRIGTSVLVKIAREGSDSFDVSIRRDLIHIDAVRHRIEGDVGYLRISSFNEHVGDELRDAISAIESQIKQEDLYGYVLDLRSNPGGLLTEAISVSETFLKGGVVVSTKDRQAEKIFEADLRDRTGGKPLVILINKGSASASEIVAGALKDHDRAVLLGERSYGKGSVQTVFPMMKGGVKLTTALYFTPSGQTVNGGIAPQYTVADDPEKDGDEQLHAAYKLVVELAGGPRINWSAGTRAN